MPGTSRTTRAVAARVPNHIADMLRQQADSNGLTMSAALNACIQKVFSDTGDSRPPSHSEKRQPESESP